jgi:hypothetical protein
MRLLTSMRTKIEAAISFASKSTLTCSFKRTWVSTSSMGHFSEAIGALLSPTPAHAIKLTVLQTGALRAGRRAQHGTGVRECEGTLAPTAIILVSNACPKPSTSWILKIPMPKTKRSTCRSQLSVQSQHTRGAESTVDVQCERERVGSMGAGKARAHLSKDYLRPAGFVRLCLS